MAGVKTIEEANQYVETNFYRGGTERLRWSRRAPRCTPAHRSRARFGLSAEPCRATRVAQDYTFSYYGKKHLIAPQSISAGAAGRDGANRAASRWFASGAFKEKWLQRVKCVLPDKSRFWSKQETQRCTSQTESPDSRAHQGLARKRPRPVSGWSERECGCQDQSHSDSRSLRLSQLQFGKPGKSSPAAYAFFAAKASARERSPH